MQLSLTLLRNAFPIVSLVSVELLFYMIVHGAQGDGGGRGLEGVWGGGGCQGGGGGGGGGGEGQIRM